MSQAKDEKGTTAGVGGASAAAKELKKAGEQKVIVIDHGSGSIKVGWSGEDAPRAVIPTVLYDNHGAPLPASIIDAQTEANDFLVGHEALALYAAAGSSAGAVTLSTPIERGLIPDWDHLTKVWEHVWRKELGVEFTEYPVLLTVPPLAPKEMRAEMAKRLLAKKVPSLCIISSAVLSLFASGRTTGLVVEVGEGVTHVVPIFEGYALPHATLRMNLAGKDLTTYLRFLLQQNNFPDVPESIVRDIKEKLCAVKLVYDDGKDGKSRAAAASGSEDMTYELPDGQVIVLDDAFRHLTGEILFRPSIYDRDLVGDGGGSGNSGSGNAAGGGVHQMVRSSLAMCDDVLRRELQQNIVLAGGTTLMAGFASRLKRELIAGAAQPSAAQASASTAASPAPGATASSAAAAASGAASPAPGASADGVSAAASPAPGATAATSGALAASALVGRKDKRDGAFEIVADSQRKFAAWIGGSMFASLPTFDLIKIDWATAKDDPNIVHKKGW